MKIIELPFQIKRPILACGADLKGAFALAKGRKAYLFDGFGDLSDPDNLKRYEKAARREIKKFRIKPAIVACDLHPNYFSTQFAERKIGKIGTDTYFSTAHTIEKWVSVPIFSLCRVQHHEAHIAAAIVDNSIKGDVIGVAFDGTGYGSDGNIWGGEFFVVRCPLRAARAGKIDFTRVAHLAYVPMPGGEAAIRQPWRMAVSYLYDAFGKKWLSLIKKFYPLPVTHYALLITKIIEKNINSPLTSSAGRLFDAVGSLVLAKKTVEKEAELPMELEKMAIELCREAYDFDIKKVAGMMKIDCHRIIKDVVRDLSGRVDKATVSSKFHNTVAEIISEVSAKLRRKFKINKVVLSGGVFQNAFLSARAKELLSKSGFEVFAHSRIPTSDSGIPIGQVAIVNARVSGK
jgi:hydrogenase maturation protein HypF